MGLTAKRITLIAAVGFAIQTITPNSAATAHRTVMKSQTSDLTEPPLL